MEISNNPLDYSYSTFQIIEESEIHTQVQYQPQGLGHPQSTASTSFLKLHKIQQTEQMDHPIEMDHSDTFSIQANFYDQIQMSEKHQQKTLKQVLNKDLETKICATVNEKNNEYDGEEGHGRVEIKTEDFMMAKQSPKKKVENSQPRYKNREKHWKHNPKKNYGHYKNNWPKQNYKYRKPRPPTQHKNVNIYQQDSPTKGENHYQVHQTISNSKYYQARIKPSGTKSWPSISFYIKGKKIVFAHRQITNMFADIIIIPYRDLTFNIYPGYIINLCEYDYRNKIRQKQESEEQRSGCYIQRCIGFENFDAISFMKIKSEREMSSCIKNTFKTIQGLKMSAKSVLLPYSRQLGSPKEIISIILKEAQENKNKNLEQIIITTNKLDLVMEGMLGFYENLKDMYDKNEIFSFTG